MDAVTPALQPPIVTTGRELTIRTTHSTGRAAADDSPVLHAAIGLAEQIRAASNEIERGRRIPPGIAAAMKEAGVFDMAMPRVWGGPELDPLTQFRVIEALAMADGSVGWVRNDRLRRQPTFPVYDSFVRPGYRLMPGPKYSYPCNWLQTMENAMDPAHTAFLHTIVSGAQFTEEFGVLPELEFVETPAGMMYIGTRRVGQNVWVRMVEAVLPNLQQVAPIWETGHQEHAFSGPMLSRWVVPIDNTNTMFIELRHVSETEGVTPAWWADSTIMAPAQLAADSYEAGQRQPGDYEAQVSQRPIAIHGLEHIGATDRGVMIFRSQTRRGIRAVQAGRDPTGLCRDSGVVIPTYCNDTVMRMPPDVDPAMDRQLMRETGRRLADGYLQDPPLLARTAAALLALGDGFPAEKGLEMNGEFTTNSPSTN
jgi:hypothetical protein